MDLSTFTCTLDDLQYLADWDNVEQIANDNPGTIDELARLCGLDYASGDSNLSSDQGSPLYEEVPVPYTAELTDGMDDVCLDTSQIDPNVYDQLMSGWNPLDDGYDAGQEIEPPTKIKATPLTPTKSTRGRKRAYTEDDYRPSYARFTLDPNDRISTIHSPKKNVNGTKRYRRSYCNPQRECAPCRTYRQRVRAGEGKRHAHACVCKKYVINDFY